MWRCCTLPNKENFPRQRPAPRFFCDRLSFACTMPHFFPTKGHNQNFLLLLVNTVCIFRHTKFMKTKQTGLSVPLAPGLYRILLNNNIQLLNWAMVVDNLAWEGCEHLHYYSTGMHSTSFWLLANVQQRRALELRLVYDGAHVLMSIFTSHFVGLYTLHSQGST